MLFETAMRSIHGLSESLYWSRRILQPTPDRETESSGYNRNNAHEKLGEIFDIKSMFLGHSIQKYKHEDFPQGIVHNDVKVYPTDFGMSSAYDADFVKYNFKRTRAYWSISHGQEPQLVNFAKGKWEWRLYPDNRGAYTWTSASLDYYSTSIN